MHYLLIVLILAHCQSLDARHGFDIRMAKELPADGTGLEVEVEVPSLPSTLDDLKTLICQIKKTDLPASVCSRLGGDIPTKSRPGLYQGMVMNISKTGQSQISTGYKYVQDQNIRVFLFEPPLKPPDRAYVLLEFRLDKFPCKQ
jgi:hypothetical protein